MKIKDFFGNIIDVTGTINTYARNKATAIQLWCEDGPYATLTVNIPKVKLGADEFIVDTNNCPWAHEFLMREWIALPTKRWEESGFCVYPVYKFTKFGKERLLGDYDCDNDFGKIYGAELAKFIHQYNDEYNLYITETQGYNSPEEIHLSIHIDCIDDYEISYSIGTINTWYDTLSQYTAITLDQELNDDMVKRFFDVAKKSGLLEVFPITAC